MVMTFINPYTLNNKRNHVENFREFYMYPSIESRCQNHISFKVESILHVSYVAYTKYVMVRTRSFSYTLTWDSQKIWWFSLADLNLYTLAHYCICTLHCSSPHISIYTPICVQKHYKLSNFTYQ